MPSEEAMETGLNKFRGVRRKSVSLGQTSLVRESSLGAGRALPLVIEPALGGVNLAQWAAADGERLEGLLLRHGALLFRGFRVEGVAGFERFARAVSPELLDYLERAAPRHEVGNKVYTSTEFPADQHIPLHHEM